MLEDADVQRCLMFATSLNHAPGWHLPEPVLLEYAQAIAQLGHLTDTLAIQSLKNYHADHQQIQALRSSDAYASQLAWSELHSTIRRIVSIKIDRSRLECDFDTMLDDVTQEAVQNTFSGLPKFRYASRFHTWLFTVTMNSLVRYCRSLQAYKRGSGFDTRSLEELRENGAAVYASTTTPPPEKQALNRILVEIVTQVLSDVPDERVRLVFQLWVFEQQTMREIGQKLSLSPARVHGLFKQATSLLKVHPVVLDWLSIEAGSRLDI